MSLPTPLKPFKYCLNPSRALPSVLWTKRRSSINLTLGDWNALSAGMYSSTLSLEGLHSTHLFETENTIAVQAPQIRIMGIQFGGQSAESKLVVQSAWQQNMRLDTV